AGGGRVALHEPYGGSSEHLRGGALRRPPDRHAGRRRRPGARPARLQRPRCFGERSRRPRRRARLHHDRGGAAPADGDGGEGGGGLGCVGLPLRSAMHTAGFRVIGVDRDEEKIARLAGGVSPIADVTDAQVAALGEGTFSAEPAPLADADVVVLCLPTPLTDGSPDLTMVLTAAEDVSRYLRPGMLVVLESTTYPGTTEELLRPILESAGL